MRDVTSAGAESLLPPDWAELRPLMDAVLDAPRADRPALLLALSDGDAHRYAALQQLIAECDRETPLLARPAGERFAALFDDEPDDVLPETLGGRYRIDREVGRGGMARVYLADDAKHARRVAIKIIRSELAASLGRERFLREIGIAARLRHPNIVPLYDSGDADGVLYFVMPYEEGPSLRARLDTTAPLSVAERVGILRDVARALAYAHEQGVVHRDVKPDNVMLSGGAAVVTDFGISTAVSVAQGDGDAAAVTQPDVGIGTPAYMAPEQAAGNASTDHRADIYSFGCLAYELFAGAPPFHDMPVHDVIAAHIGTKPVPIQDVGADVPAGVAALIERCLEKNPDARPASAQELLVHLERAATRPGLSVRRRRYLRAAIVSVLGVAAVLISGRAYRASRAHVVDSEANRYYTIAQRALNRRGFDISTAVENFRRATTLDTLFAQAYSGLSLALALTPNFEPESPDSVAPEAIRSAERAVRLDPALAQPHIALGLVYQNARDWDHAGNEFRKAIALEPRAVEARVQYGRHLLFRNRLADALSQFLTARNEDAASALVSSWVSYSYYIGGQLDSAFVESVRAFESDSTNATTLALGSLVRLRTGRVAAAREFIERGPPTIWAVFYILAAIGDTADAMARLRAFESAHTGGWQTQTNRAFAMLGAGDTARALTAFEQATDANENWHAVLATRDPVFDPIRNSRRFDDLLRRVGLH